MTCYICGRPLEIKDRVVKIYEVGLGDLESKQLVGHVACLRKG